MRQLIYKQSNAMKQNLHECIEDIRGRSSESKPRIVLGKPTQFAENPYQDNLITHLKALEVSVNQGTLKDFLLANSEGKESPNVIHLHWLHLYYQSRSYLTSILRIGFFAYKLIRLKISGAKLAWTVHNLSSHDNKRPNLDLFINIFVAHLSDVMFVHCELAKEKASQKFRVGNKSKIHVIPHGNYIGCYENTINPQESRAALSIPKESITLLFMGTIRPNKGIYDLINAFETLNHSKLHLIVAGKPYPGQEDIIRERLQGRSNTTFIPEYVPDDEIQNYMNAADVVVFPYKDILTSGAVVLAMSYGRACIAPGIGCMGETIDDGLGGFLYDPKDPEGLMKALQKTIQQHHQLPAMGAHNLLKAKQWSWESIAQKTLCAYQQCF
jgi:beta-1,4-mannosyltransferase